MLAQLPLKFHQRRFVDVPNRDIRQALPGHCYARGDMAVACRATTIAVVPVEPLHFFVGDTWNKHTRAAEQRFRRLHERPALFQGVSTYLAASRLA